MNNSFFTINEKQTNCRVIFILWFVVFIQFSVAFILEMCFHVFTMPQLTYVFSGLLSAFIALIPTLLYNTKRWAKLVKYFNVFGIYLMLVLLHFITRNDLALQGAWVAAITLSCLYFEPYLICFAGMLSFFLQVIFGFVLPINVKLDPEFIGSMVITQLFVSFGLAAILWSLSKKANKVLNNLNTTLNSIGDAVITLSVRGKINVMNKIAEELTGWNIEESYGKELEEVFQIIKKPTGVDYKKVTQEVLQSGIIIPLEHNTVLLSRYGGRRYIDGSCAPIKNKDGHILGVVLVFRDITEKILKEEKIRALCVYDKLTGLYNRYFFEEELKSIDKTHLPITLILGDINGLKLINDIFGHQEGDRVLQQIADIIKKTIRKEDIAARWGGDEFAIILPRTGGRETVTICSRIMNAYAETGEKPIKPSLTLGIATKEKPDQDFKSIFKEAEDRMYRHKLLESRSIHSLVITSLEKTLNEKSFETEEHAQRIYELSMKIGHEIGLSENEIDELSILAKIHDIGKIAIPDNILKKTDKLTPDEWKEMKKHPEIGFRMASISSEFSNIAEYILSHHEHWDGTGYPRGLKGMDIPKLARIISVVDAYDAMTYTRPYKEAIHTQEALEEIFACSGTQFDPEIVDIFIKIISNQFDIENTG